MTESGAVGDESRPPAAVQVNGGQSALRALRDRANTVLPGLYAWLTTVAMPSVRKMTRRELVSSPWSAFSNASFSESCRLVEPPGVKWKMNSWQSCRKRGLLIGL